ncbi:MAG TPA: hypothetical protein PK280_19475 [Planctomycetota bacterium]|nr:hypothetical protein [Planctomycetota bacterium]
MAAMIGRGKSWLWWLAGLLCAALFGRVGAAEEPVQALYGVRVEPGFVGPGDPSTPMPPPPSQLDVNLRQRANQLIDEYLAAQTEAAPAGELQARIERLVKDLGADDWGTREKAQKELVSIGRPALAALKAAAGSKDPEIAQRSTAAIAQIDGAGNSVDQLRAIGPLARTVVQERLAAERKAVTGRAGGAGEAELAGRKDEAEKLRAEAKKAQANAALLVKLTELLTQPARGPEPVMMPFGVKMRVIERD